MVPIASASARLLPPVELVEGRRLRIAHCIHGLSLAGAQQVIRHLVACGDPEHFRYFVYAHLDGPLRVEIERAGATVRLIRRRLPLVDPFWALEIYRVLRRDQIDVVHTHLFGDTLHGLVAAKAAGLPVVSTLHSNRGGETRLRRWGYGRLLPYMDCLVACSPSSRASYVRAYGERLTIRTIVNGITRAPLRELGARVSEDLGLEPDALIIGSIGRQSVEKGFSDLLRAFGHVVSERVGKVQLVLVGDGPERPRLEALARQLGIADRVVFAGVRTDVRELLQRFTLVAFSSHFEGMPIAVLEAMAAGRCIVASDAEGIVNCVDDGREALLAPRHDPPALARALERALSDALLREQLGRAAQARFLREFQAERMAEEYQQLYLELVEERERA